MRITKTLLSRGSLTLEAALVLPLFLMACITLVSFMDAVKLQTKESLSLSNKARQLAMAGALAGSAGDGVWIDLCIPKAYNYPFPIIGVPKLWISVRARVYPWVGIDGSISKGGGDEQESSAIVYITDNNEVYHSDPNCTHLDLTIRKSTTDEIGGLRNEYGKKYKKCSGFPKGYSGDVYYSEKGDYYYPSSDYGAITRHVHAVDRTDCGNLPPCSRCAGGS